jgi:hypothetical protein
LRVRVAVVTAAVRELPALLAETLLLDQLVGEVAQNGLDGLVLLLAAELLVRVPPTLLADALQTLQALLALLAEAQLTKVLQPAQVTLLQVLLQVLDLLLLLQLLLLLLLLLLLDLLLQLLQ